MSTPPERPYRSAVRQRQADETRQRIAAAARRLFQSAGFEATTIDAIAREAEVAPQTVYAVFRNKRGVLADLLERAAFGPAYEGLVRQAMGAADPAERVRFAARIARQIYDARKAEVELFRGAGVVAPELAAMEREGECGRYEAQGALVTSLAEAGRLRPGLDTAAARDVLWALTGQDLYRMLVQERGWTSDRYEAWLADQIAASLLAPEVVPGPGGRARRSR